MSKESDLAASSKAIDQTCSLCEFEFTKESDNNEELPFSCCTCESNNVSTEKQLLCIVCVSHHVRILHRVLDSKGYEVSVCHQHKSIDELFCADCDHAFCRLCILSHRDHKFIPIHEKCTETRKEVFKYINDFDSLTKDVKFELQVQRDCLKALVEALDLCNPNTVLDILIKIIGDMVRDVAKEDGIQKLMADLKEKFRKDSSKMTLAKANSVEFDQLVTKSDQIEKNLRQVLQNSDAVLVKEFKDMIVEMDNSLKQQRDRVASVSYMHPFYIDNSQFDSQLSSLITGFLKAMVWPTAFTKEPHFVLLKTAISISANLKVVFHPFDVYSAIQLNDQGQIALISIEKCANLVAVAPTVCQCCAEYLSTGYGYCLYCYTVAEPLDPYKTVSFVNLPQPQRDISTANQSTLLKLVEVVYPFGVEVTPILGDFVAMYEEGFFKANIFDNSANVVSLKLLFSNQNIELCMLVFYSTELAQLNCLIYDEKSKEIRPILEDKTFGPYHCPEKPAAVTVSTDFKTFFAALKSTSEIHIFSHRQTEIIPPVHHGLRSIDALHFVIDKDKNTPALLVWDFTKQICVILNQYNSKYITVGAVSPKVPDNCSQDMKITDVKVVNQLVANFPDMIYVFYIDENNKTLSSFKISVKELLTSVQ